MSIIAVAAKTRENAASLWLSVVIQINLLKILFYMTQFGFVERWATVARGVAGLKDAPRVQGHPRRSRVHIGTDRGPGRDVLGIGQHRNPWDSEGIGERLTNDRR